uniref:Uncharacterized protein n=1 Tax=Nelumbo nucifera TaxID=4432 RepID=A0A822ZGQ1_NELNU|nr:TPA_asm: hypothetical protein HUJ06_002542 [Nelumbo nucifera]
MIGIGLGVGCMIAGKLQFLLPMNKVTFENPSNVQRQGKKETKEETDGSKWDNDLPSASDETRPLPNGECKKL